MGNWAPLCVPIAWLPVCSLLSLIGPCSLSLAPTQCGTWACHSPRRSVALRLCHSPRRSVALSGASLRPHPPPDAMSPRATPGVHAASHDAGRRSVPRATPVGFTRRAPAFDAVGQSLPPAVDAVGPKASPLTPATQCPSVPPRGSRRLPVSTQYPRILSTAYPPRRSVALGYGSSPRPVCGPVLVT
jgi:hypothetical protein